MTIATGVKKGSRLTLEPIHKAKDIKSISSLLRSRHRDYLLWVLGINNWLRAPLQRIFDKTNKLRERLGGRAGISYPIA